MHRYLRILPISRVEIPKPVNSTYELYEYLYFIDILANNGSHETESNKFTYNYIYIY